TCVAWSGDGSRLATGSGPGLIQVWDAATGGLLHTFRGHTPAISCAAFSPDGALLAASCLAGVKIWDLAHGHALHFMPRPRATEPLLGFRPDGQRVHLRGHAAVLAFTPDGRRLAVSGLDSTIKFWDVSTWQETFTLRLPGRPAQLLAFSPDGHLFAC